MILPFQGAIPYISITQDVVLGYMLRGFQPIERCDSVSLEMSDEPCLLLLPAMAKPALFQYSLNPVQKQGFCIELQWVSC